MEKIKVNHKFNECHKKTEENKIKWLISVLEKKYSVKNIEISVSKIKEEAHDLVS